WEEGLSASLQCGLRALLDSPEAARLENVLTLLGDMPLVRQETLALLCTAHHEARAGNPKHAATVPLYQGRRGNPVVLSRLIIPRLFDLSGDVGARALLTEFARHVAFLPVDDHGVLFDVDCPEDYAALAAEG
ncbi:MAG: NTP transferase domain-containing protein, partial [Deltaproteobacteria bacterium]|nr:NTP transferase domain-containing protein [Deltaproteobacteria bacterium]